MKYAFDYGVSLIHLAGDLTKSYDSQASDSAGDLTKWYNSQASASIDYLAFSPGKQWKQTS